MTEFSDEELERYARHIVLREVGGPGQRKLKAARVLVVGAGGLGAPVLMYLAAAGVGYLRVVDDDAVSLSNLQRQVIFSTGDIGMSKVSAAAAALARINPNVVVEPVAARLDGATAAGLVGDMGLVLDGSDNFATRYTVNEACVGAGVPLVAGAISQWEGQVSLYHPAGGAPCYACVFPTPPAAGLGPSCAEAGVMGALAGIVGTIMAAEALKAITGAGETLAGTLLIHDSLWGESRRMRVARDPACAVCGAGADMSARA